MLARCRTGGRKFGCRWITIQQPVTTVIDKPIQLNQVKTGADETAKVIDTSINEDEEEPVIKVLGTPSSILSVNLPPSIPIHVKKGSIISVYSKQSSDNQSGNNQGDTGDEKMIQSKLQVDKPLRNILLGNGFLNYQQVMGSIPLQLLISAYSNGGANNESTKSFVNLKMDGSYDWCLFKPKALQCYLGNSLNVKINKMPSHLNLTERGYILLKGRGLVSLVGSGNVFKICLNNNEEIRIDRRNLLAATINNERELSNFKSETWSSVDGMFHKNEESVQREKIMEAKEMEKQEVKLTSNIYIDKSLTMCMKLANRMVTLFKQGKVGLSDYLLGSGNYIVIRGPHTLLIDSGSGNDSFVVNSNNVLSHGNEQEVEKYIREEEEWGVPEVKRGDNLGVVKIEGGKAVYKNVENFDDEVRRIEALAKK